MTQPARSKCSLSKLGLQQMLTCEGKQVFT